MGKTTGIFRVLLVTCIAVYFIEEANCDASVNVDGRQIVGQSVYAGAGVVHQYLAIPYAAPPTGRLRFKRPVPPRYLPELFFAYNEPATCWQRSPYPFPAYDPSPLKSEDCLYLNIWTPEKASPTNKKAVIYFIHGGGFRFGSVKQVMYNGAPLAERGDVIVVTVSYRLETFGFLTSGTEDAPGNVGLYDMLEGLKWVNKHIEAFGGDKSRITLAGQGAGSTAAGLLSTSPLAQGLFQRVIMESGSPGYSGKDSLKKNLEISQEVAERLFCANKTHTIQNNPADVVKCLRNVKAEDLTDISAAMNSLSTELYVPQFGDELLPKNPLNALQHCNFSCIDILIGNTNDEGSYLLTTHNPEVYGFFGALDPEINKTLGTDHMKEMFKKFPDNTAVVKQYLPESIPDDDYDTIRQQVYTSFGDAAVVCPATFYAEQSAANGGKVYYYVWNHRPTVSIWFDWMGVAHGTEVEFVFGIPLLHSFQYQPDELDLSKKIIDIWSSFAKNGTPNVPWPEFSKENPLVKVLGPGSKDIINQVGFHRENCEFFRPYFQNQTELISF